MLLVGILLYQNPVFIVSTIFPYQYYLFVVSIAVKAFAVSYTFVFWLMVKIIIKKSYNKNDKKTTKIKQERIKPKKKKKINK
jgi:hypothetical protein